MIIHQVDQLEFWSFEQLEEHCVHGILTRKGGVSPSPWDSLNFGGNIGDSRQNIIENRRRVFSAINRPVESIFDSWQVHGTGMIITDKPRNLDEIHQKADIIATRDRKITLFMRFADCTPILLFDPEHAAICMVHAGWRGTLAGAVKAAVAGMREGFSSRPEKIIAGIGPSIGPDHYRVGNEVIQAAEISFGSSADEFLLQKNGGYYFDLWAANEFLLRQAGVEFIERSNICTACDLTRWYSHRAENGKTGRFGAFLAIR